MSRLQTPHEAMEFEYDKAGRIAKRRMPGELEESFYYDRCGRIIEQSLDKPGHTLFLRGYKYDPEGNLIELADSKKGTGRFAYDPVERLREVTQPEREIERFAYDSTGNLLRRGEREFRYDQPDRLTRMDDATLIYDEAGNLIEKRRGGSVIRYSYDPDNQLNAVESKEGGRIEFAYDAFGRRIAKKTKGGETGFLWDGDVLLEERRVDSSIEYVFRLGNCEPLCRYDEARFENYHNDHLGTPRDLTNKDGQVVWSASYDAYGGIRKLHSYVVENQIRFQGQYDDPEIGLHYNLFRYYDPVDGVYITQDPIGITEGLNVYTYSDNPLKWVDPYGLNKKPPTPATLPDKVIYNEDGVRVWHNYGNPGRGHGTQVEHGPVHFHVKHRDDEYQLFPSGRPLRSSKEPPREVQDVFTANRSRFTRISKRIGRWFQAVKAEKEARKKNSGAC